jgi:hypothetical protein
MQAVIRKHLMTVMTLRRSLALWFDESDEDESIPCLLQKGVHWNSKYILIQ